MLLGVMSSLSFASGKTPVITGMRNKKLYGKYGVNYGGNKFCKFSPAQYNKVRKYIRGRNIGPKRLTKEQMFEISLCFGIPFFVVVLIIYAMCGSENGSLEQEKIGDISSKSGISDKSSEKGGSKGAAPAAGDTKVDNGIKLEGDKKKEILKFATKEVDVELKNDYTSYISSDRVLSNDEIMMLEKLACKFNMIPFKNNNCYASTAMCMIADPRDVKDRLDKFDKSGNYNKNRIEWKQKEYIKFLREIGTLGDSKRREYLSAWSGNIKSLYRLESSDASQTLDQLYDKYYYDGQEDIGAFFGGLFSIYGFLDGNLGGKMCIVFNHKDTSGKLDNYAEAFIRCLGDDNSFVSVLNRNYMIADDCNINESGGNLFDPSKGGSECFMTNIDDKVYGVLDSDAFTIRAVKREASSETNPFGKVSLKKFQNEDKSRSYLVSDIAVHYGGENSGHWYEDVIVYDEKTLSSEVPKVIAVIKLSNTNYAQNGQVSYVVPEIITGQKNIKKELEFASTNGTFYRYREISDDNKNVYSI